MNLSSVHITYCSNAGLYDEAISTYESLVAMDTVSDMPFWALTLFRAGQWQRAKSGDPVSCDSHT